MFLDSLFKFPRQVHVYKSAQFRRLNQGEKLARLEDFESNYVGNRSFYYEQFDLQIRSVIGKSFTIETLDKPALL